MAAPVTTRPVVGNNSSFSVSAWAQLPAGLESCGEPCAGETYPVISQDGQNVPGFTLGYGAGCGCWVFDMPASDSASATPYSAQSPRSAPAEKAAGRS